MTEQGTYKFKKDSKLSNYYECNVRYDGIMYKSSEAAYQAAKFNNITIKYEMSKIDPDSAKRYARKLEALGCIRPDWEYVKDRIMYEICLSKFTSNYDCRKTLLQTGNRIIIENTTGWHDVYWGKCYCKECNGHGLNKLGLILMRVRDMVRNI